MDDFGPFCPLYGLLQRKWGRSPLYSANKRNVKVSWKVMDMKILPTLRVISTCWNTCYTTVVLIREWSHATTWYWIKQSALTSYYSSSFALIDERYSLSIHFLSVAPWFTYTTLTSSTLLDHIVMIDGRCSTAIFILRKTTRNSYKSTSSTNYGMSNEKFTSLLNSRASISNSVFMVWNWYQFNSQDFSLRITSNREVLYFCTLEAH